MTVQPGFFGPPASPLFGWLHATEADRPALGVVLCAPLGDEVAHSWRALQTLAEALAAQGLPCLRFDWPGCGDSADRAEDPVHGLLPAWQDGLEAAIEHLCAAAGVRQVAVLAIRAGVLVAAEVAARRPEVRAFAAIAPSVSGRHLLREWRALAATAALQASRDDGTLEVAGAAFGPATVRALGERSLAEHAWPAERPVLLVDRDDLPAATRWQARLQADGVPLTALTLGGLADMLQAHHAPVVPEGLAAAVTGWLASLARSVPAAAGAASALPRPTADGRGEARVAPGVRERLMTVDAEGTPLFGILAEPEPPGGSGALLLLPNTGGIHHIGGHRLYVRLARRLAAEGHRVIRFDLSGLGESPARPGEPPDAVYGRRSVDDLAAVLRAARERWPDRRPMLLGLCAGGYHALRLAVREPGVDQCIVVNPLVYHWHEGMSLDAQESQVQEAYYRAKWRRWESWARLLSGRSDLRHLAQVAAARLRRAIADAVRTVRNDRPPAVEPDDLNRDLLAAAAHGTRLQFVFSSGEPGWPALQTQGAEALARLRPDGRLAVHHLEQADHTLTTESARERFVALVAALLAARVDAEGPAARQPAAPVAAAPPAMPVLEH